MKPDATIGLEITLKIGCPMNCSYCPQELLLKKYPKDAPRAFTLESFQKCLASVPVTRHLTFMGACEPFQNKQATAMMQWSHDRGHELSISTTLFGATHEDIDAVAKMRMTDMVVHVPADDGRMNLEPTDEWMELLKHAVAAWRHNPEFLISVFGRPHPKILPFWLESGIPLVNFTYHNRAGLLSGRHQDMAGRALPFPSGVHRNPGQLPICGKQFCGHLLPNGDVVRCCNDYGMECLWGNLNENTYAEIYAGEKFKAYMRSLADPSSEIPCRYCHDGFKSVNKEDRHKTYKDFE